jgi:glycosyltransferase involved in cell wall biosynthesis
MLSWLFFPHLGGVERHVFEVSRRLIAKGHDVRLLTLRYDGSLPRDEIVRGIPVRRIGKGGSGGPPLLRILAGWISALPARDLFSWADILHFHDHAPFVRWYLPQLLLPGRKPLFVTFHGFERERPGRREKIERRLLARMASGRICVGSWIRKYYGTGCDVVTLGGTDAPLEDAGAKERRGLILGRLESDTGLFTYLKALTLLKERHGVSVPVEVLGSGSMFPDAEEYSSRHGLAIEFRGTTANVPAFLRKASFVFASSYLSMLEAMAHGCLVLASPTSELKRDYLASMREDAGGEIAVVREEARELADELARFLARPEERRAALAAAAAFASRWTWDRLADSYLELYARVPAGRAG